MLAVIYLLAITVAGIALVQRLAPGMPPMVKLAGGFVAGIVFGAWVTYIVAAGLSTVTDESLTVGVLVALAASGAVIGLLGRGLRAAEFRLSAFEVVFIGLSLAFSFWLMDNRLAIDHSADGDPLVVSANTWGDTALHVALARSFSLGENYPTEYPFFALEPIRYHFGYDFFAGALQQAGMSDLLSFNLPGALGFTAMMMLLFSIARMLFPEPGWEEKRPWWRNRGVWVGLVAVCLLLTNSSLSFLRYFDQYDTIAEALKPVHWFEEHDRYLAVGPYNVGGVIDQIAIFNTLNVFLTQTHLIIAMAGVLFVAFGLLQPLRGGQGLPRERMLLLGVLFGASFWLNGVLYIAAGMFFGALLVIFAGFGAYRHSMAVPADGYRVNAFAGEFWRWTRMAAWFIVPALALAVPQATWLNGGLENNGSVRIHVGYLVCSSPAASCNADGAEMDLLNPAHWYDFLEYWWLNMGLALPLLVVAFVIGSRSDKKIIAAIMTVFLFGSLVQLSRDLGGHNHKVFNLWEILTNVFVAYALVEVWNTGVRKLGSLDLRSPALRPFAYGLVVVLFGLLVLSGLLDFMTVKNDFKVAVFGNREPTIDWIEKNTPRDAVFMTTWGELYTSPTLAGRRVFLGYDPWASSAGYEVEARIQLISQVYGAQSRDAACAVLQDNDIDYLVVGPEERAGGRFTLNEALFAGQFKPAGTVEQSGEEVVIYDVEESCRAQATATRSQAVSSSALR
jgi:hypothetical protein